MHYAMRGSHPGNRFHPGNIAAEILNEARCRKPALQTYDGTSEFRCRRLVLSLRCPPTAAFRTQLYLDIPAIPDLGATATSMVGVSITVFNHCCSTSALVAGLVISRSSNHSRLLHTPDEWHATNLKAHLHRAQAEEWVLWATSCIPERSSTRSPPARQTPMQ